MDEPGALPPFRLADVLAKAWRHGPPRHSLAASGLRARPWRERGLPAVDADPAALDLDGGDLPRRLARRVGVAPDQVVVTGGTSLANAAALLALVRPGMEVACERPTYEALPALATGLGARVVHVDRQLPGWRLDPADVAVPRGGLLVLSSPNNPTAAPATRSDLAALGDAAAAQDAYVLVDQVYRELTDHAPAIHPRIVATAGLNKCWGAPGLRLGWAIAAPDVAARIQAAHRLLALAPPPVAAAHALLDHEPECRRELERRLAANHATYAAWCQRVGVEPPVHRGLVAFPAVPAGTAARAAASGVLVPDGALFGRTGHVRIGLGEPPAAFAAALEALAPHLRKGH